jgi:hypothetical protein
MCGCNVREREIQREHGGKQVESFSRERTCFSFSGALKTYANLWERADPGDSHAIINEWGGARVVPGQV